MARPRRDPAKRFWEKVDKSGDCWEWTASKAKDGYGQFMVNKKNVKVHRFVFSLMGIEIPSGMQVCHSCDNPACVNPDHLWFGTQKENIMDMMKKGRDVTASIPGSKNGSSKLTEEDVIEIRRDNRPYRVIAKDYGVGKSTIGYIKAGSSWRHV